MATQVSGKDNTKDETRQREERRSCSFPNLCNAKNEQFTGGTLRSAIVKALGPGEQLTPDHDGVLKQIFCISDSGVDTGSVTYTASCHCLLHLHLAGARSCRTRPSAPKGDE